MKKLIVIGAGIAGMSAGIYGQLNGFDTEIYEMHSIPGGECTGWDRGEYHFDGCIHWMMGTKSGTPLNKIWKEVGALDESIAIVNNEYYFRFEENGEAVNFYKNVDKLEKHLLELSPLDSEFIHAFCKAIRVFRRMEMPVDKPMNMYSKIEMMKMAFKMLPLFSSLKKYGSITIKDLAEQFKSPLLQHAIEASVPKGYSSMALFMMLASMNSGDSGWPMGGSRKMARRMESKYQSLGGKIHYRSKVNKIKIVDGKAVGVILSDGREVYADYIISAADGYYTLQNMLDGKYMDDTFKKLYSINEEYPTYTTVQVSVGINCDLSKEPSALYFRPSQSIDAGGVTHNAIGLKHFCYDKSIAPSGKSVITALMDADYEWWEKKHENREVYKAEKQRIAMEVCSAIEERYPETKGKINQVDIATPMTYVRYCNAWRGAWMSWMVTPKSKINNLSGKLNGLNNFYMSGQWNMPSGLPGAVTNGKWTIQRICKELKSEFKTSI